VVSSIVSSFLALIAELKKNSVLKSNDWLFRSYSASRFGDMVPLSVWGKYIKVYLLVHLFSEGVAGERYPVG
jgi:hypothetical protein